MKKLWFVLAMMACIFASCSDGGSDNPVDPTPKPEEVKTEITIDSGIVSNGLSFGVTEGEQSVSFSVNANWTLSIASTTSGAAWCKASVTSGSKGTANVKFTVDENTGYDDRSVSVTIKAGSVSKTFTITQKGADALLVTTNKYEVVQEGGQIEIEVKANIDYQMEISEAAKSWITEASSRALNTYKHKLDIALNEDSEKREGEITFKSGDKVETVKIYQAGGAIILLSQNEYTVSDAGETISVDIKSNVEYGVQMPDVDWVTDEASSRGMSSHTLKYVIAANETYDSRSAEIIFYDKNSDLKDTLRVVQAQKDAIVISQKTYDVKAEGETIEVKLSANVDFEVTMPDVDWISQTESRALKEHTLYLKVAENTGEESRNAEIVFTNKDSQISESISIDQEGKFKGSYSNGVVTVVKAGTMFKLLDDYKSITSLKIIGPINGQDIVYLRLMLSRSGFSYNERKTGELSTLDLSEAIIVAGEGRYEIDKCTTIDNVIVEKMFASCEGLENIVLPTSIISIDKEAFACCKSLKSIIIPDSVTSIGESAFVYCSSLSSVAIGNGVISIGKNAFEECGSLSSVTFGKGVTSIGESAFHHCFSLSSITIPDNISSIAEKTFYNCSSLSSVAIGNNVASIGNSAFYACSSLFSVVIPNGVTSIDAYAFGRCEALTNLVVGDGVISIGESAFSDCTSLSSVIIPDNVISIADKAFSGCTSLTSLTIGNGITSISKETFKDSPLTSVYISNALNSIGDDAFYSCRDSINVYISDLSAWYNIDFYDKDSNPLYQHNSSSNKGDEFYLSKKRVTELTVPDDITEIKKYAFYHCESINKITIPDHVTLIGERAFYDCDSLTSVIIGDGVKTISEYAFYHSHNVNKVILGKGLEKVEINAFGIVGPAEVYCYATTPPSIVPKSNFDKIDYKTAKLYVPKGAYSAYYSSDWRKIFVNIVEMEE